MLIIETVQFCNERTHIVEYLERAVMQGVNPCPHLKERQGDNDMYIDMYGLMWLSIGFFVFGGCFYHLFGE